MGALSLAYSHDLKLVSLGRAFFMGGELRYVLKAEAQISHL